MISLIAVSLIHATINIPAFAVYVEPDMNAELMAHIQVSSLASFVLYHVIHNLTSLS